MKKKILISILLLVCFWHFNVRAEELTNVVNTTSDEVVESQNNEASSEEANEEKKEEEIVSSVQNTPKNENVFQEQNSEIENNEVLVEEEKSEEKNIDEIDGVEAELTNEVDNQETDPTDVVETTEDEPAEVVNSDEVIDNINNDIETSENGNTEEEGSYKVTFGNSEFNLSIPGGGNVLLSELLSELGINITLNEIAEIQISNNEVLKANRVTNSNDYVIESLKSFNTIEMITIYLNDGSEIKINVVDPDGPKHLKDLIND